MENRLLPSWKKEPWEPLFGKFLFWLFKLLLFPENRALTIGEQFQE